MLPSAVSAGSDQPCQRINLWFLLLNASRSGLVAFRIVAVFAVSLRKLENSYFE